MAGPAENLDPAPGALGRSLRGLRKARGITLKELALGIGRSVGFLSQIERGISDPSMTDLRRIAKAFDVPTSRFFLLEDEDTPEQKYIVCQATHGLSSSAAGSPAPRLPVTLPNSAAPANIALAMGKGARQMGALIFENIKVLDINTKAGRVSSVVTRGGPSFSISQQQK